MNVSSYANGVYILVAAIITRIVRNPIAMFIALSDYKGGAYGEISARNTLVTVYVFFDILMVLLVIWGAVTLILTFRANKRK
jgi:hypothetical protein